MSCILWETAWISVVARTGSSGEVRPFDSIRCEAKMVLIKVDFPSPVWPIQTTSQSNITLISLVKRESRTNTDDIELKSSFQQLPFNLRSDTVETDMTSRKDCRLLLSRKSVGGGHCGLVRGLWGEGRNIDGIESGFTRMDASMILLRLLLLFELNCVFYLHVLSFISLSLLKRAKRKGVLSPKSHSHSG